MGGSFEGSGEAHWLPAPRGIVASSPAADRRADFAARNRTARPHRATSPSLHDCHHANRVIRFARTNSHAWLAARAAFHGARRADGAVSGRQNPTARAAARTTRGAQPIARPATRLRD